MRHLLRPLLVIGACTALYACASQGGAPPAARYATRHTLAEGQDVELAPRVRLTYDSVEDSRCPPDVRCVAAGQLVYQFTLSSGGVSEQFTLTPGQPGVAPAALGGARIELDESVEAPPARQSQAAPAPHPVALKVLAP